MSNYALHYAPNTAPPRLADYSEWEARDYFETYYSEIVLPDEEQVLTYELEILESRSWHCGRALEYGCGPTLHRAIAAARHAFRIDMADWVPDNLRQIRRWLDSGDGNTDWNRFTRYILAHEACGDVDARRIARREALARKVIRELRLSDARWRHPLGAAREGFYDLIVSGFCIDAISRDRRIWNGCMRNVLSTLRGGGLLILHALHRCTAYRVADRLFPCADLSADDLLDSLVENGFVRSSIDVQFVPCPENAQYGYSGILMASGRKR
ncbi:MAG: guanitoxin biosynthesis pre-guanitoxin forming N-methyltransferase GntF [Steroidobacteraceae bacterium]